MDSSQPSMSSARFRSMAPIPILSSDGCVTKSPFRWILLGTPKETEWMTEMFLFSQEVLLTRQLSAYGRLSHALILLGDDPPCPPSDSLTSTLGTSKNSSLMGMVKLFDATVVTIPPSISPEILMNFLGWSVPIRNRSQTLVIISF